MNFKINILIYTFFCFFVFLFSFINELTSIFLSIFLGFFLIWRAKLDGLIGLIILYIIKQNFYHVIDYKSMGNVAEVNFDRATLYIFNFPINLPTLVCFFVPLRVIFENFKNKKTLTKHKFIYRLWLFALIPGFISFIISFLNRDPNWTRGFRFLLLSSSFFYGFILAKDFKNEDFKFFTKYLLSLLAIILCFLTFNLFWSHLGFLFLGLISTFSIYFIRKINLIDKIFGFLFLIFSLIFVINSTITIMLISLISNFLILISWFYSNLNNSSYKYKIKKVKIILLSFSIIFPFLIIFIGNKLGIEIGYVDLNSSSAFKGRILEKVLLDRYPFWTSAFNQIINGPYFFVSSGRPLIVNGLDSQFEWLVGAHNVVLEVLRNTGFLVGGIILFIYLYALNQLFNVLMNTNSNLLKAFVSGLIGVAVSGILTGDFPADMTVGFALWTLSGLVTGINENRFNYNNFISFNK
jgi:hypothetical protein